MNVNAETFRNELTKIFINTKEQNKEYVDIISLDLHKQVGYDSSNHRMATCCIVMKSMMKPKDKIISEPPKGKGSTLKIRYFIE